MIYKCGNLGNMTQVSQWARPSDNIPVGWIAIGVIATMVVTGRLLVWGRMLIRSLALPAIAVMLSFVGDAMAERPSSASRDAVRSCCASRVCPMGCCVPGRAPSRSGANEQPVARFSRTVSLTDSGSSCDCRPSEPAAPASPQQSRSGESRPSTDRSIAFLPVLTAQRGVLAQVIEPAPRPPKSPLYLTTTRLLI